MNTIFLYDVVIMTQTSDSKQQFINEVNKLIENGTLSDMGKAATMIQANNSENSDLISDENKRKIIDVVYKQDNRHLYYSEIRLTYDEIYFQQKLWWEFEMMMNEKK